MVKLVMTTFIRMKGTSSRFSRLQTVSTPRLWRQTQSLAGSPHSAPPLFTTTPRPCSSADPPSQSSDPGPRWSNTSLRPQRRPLTSPLTGWTCLASPGWAPSPPPCPASSTAWCSPPSPPGPQCGSTTTSRPRWSTSGGGGRRCIRNPMLAAIKDQTRGTQPVQQETI